MKTKMLPAAILVFIFLAISVSCASAIETQEYRNADFDMKRIRTVVVMPIKLPAAIVDGQLTKSIKYRWGELIHMKRGEGGYAVLTPDQLLQKHYATQGIKPKKWANDLERVRYVNETAPKYADAMLTMTIISCDYSSYNIPESYASGDEYVEVKDWDEHGRITARTELVTERTLRPARTVRMTKASCRAELWSMAGGKQTLVYSCIASETKDSELYGDKLPTVEKVTIEVMDHVMKRVPVK